MSQHYIAVNITGMCRKIHPPENIALTFTDSKGLEVVNIDQFPLGGKIVSMGEFHIAAIRGRHVRPMAELEEIAAALGISYNKLREQILRYARPAH